MSAIIGRFLEIHIIQPVPYANLNRDDTNSVKTLQWGGRNRTRVSSQSWKRAMRLHLQQSLGQGALRTRRLAEGIAQHLEDKHGWPTDLAAKAGRHAVVASSVGAEAPRSKADEAKPDEAWNTAAMVYVPDSAVEELAALAVKYRDELGQAKDPAKFERKHAKIPTSEVDAVLRSRNGVISLFGRMLAQVDDAKVDGAVQVAHAFTTHETNVEIDYFSAVDDINDSWGDNTGSAHMGHTEHSAGVLYRYVALDLRDLHKNLGGSVGDTRALAEAFIQAALLSMPQAKKNSTGPNTIPHLAHVTVRTDRPVSYAAAFEKPVRADRHGGHTEPSVTALSGYADAASRLLGTSGLLHAAHATLSTESASALGERAESFDDLITKALDKALDKETT